MTELTEKQRSSAQNRSLHKALTEISNDLTQQGIEQRTILNDLVGYTAPVTPTFLKEVFKTIVYTMYRKTSTTELTTKEMVDSWDVFSKFLGEQYGIEYTWPSQEALYWEQLVDNEQYQ